MNDVDMMNEESRKPCVLLCPMGEARTCGKMDDEQHAQPYHAQIPQSTPIQSYQPLFSNPAQGILTTFI